MVDSGRILQRSRESQTGVLLSVQLHPSPIGLPDPIWHKSPFQPATEPVYLQVPCVSPLLPNVIVVALNTVAVVTKGVLVSALCPSCPSACLSVRLSIGLIAEKRSRSWGVPGSTLPVRFHCD